MSMIENLKKMMSEPASKEWFKKYGSPKGKALQKVGRRLSKAEIKEKTKNWPKSDGKEAGMKAQMGRYKENKAFQNKTGRAWND